MDGSFRIGHGYDIHRIEAGRRMMLAGVEVSDEIGPIAHSDGDVVIHALVDALLGALAWGDIGEHFAENDMRWKDAPSRIFLDSTMARMQEQNWRVINADITVMAERPRLKPYKSTMCKSLAGLLQVGVDCVNIKAGTNEECDAVGRGEAIAAHAVVLLCRSV